MVTTAPLASPPPGSGRAPSRRHRAAAQWRRGGGDAALDAALIAAHSAGDQAALVRLYAQAGDAAEAAGEIDAACFYLTHAYVFALASAAAEADALHARLLARGREE
jgi:hypothetical protein